MLTQERLKQVVRYHPEDGTFVRLECFQRPDVIGTCAPCDNGNGYRKIAIDGRRYYMHRLAWFYMTGKWPIEIDHKNGDRSYNSWSNIRDVSSKINHQNRRKAASNSKSGILGVSWDSERLKWTARIKVEGRYKYLGRFESKEQAMDAYLSAKRKYHEGCTI